MSFTHEVCKVRSALQSAQNKVNLAYCGFFALTHAKISCLARLLPVGL